MTDEKKRIIEILESMESQFSGYEIFSDWVKCMAVSISNSIEQVHDEVWQKREDEYLAIAKKHGRDNINKFAEMMRLLALSLEKEMDDCLGDIYMRANLGSKNAGQFFTPFHLSYMSAKLALNKYDGKEKILVNEPSTGGGGMMIATAKVLKEKGFNYQNCLEVIAQDLDWKGVYMTYVQLSLLGVNATVIQGDTLAQTKPEEYQIFRTPKKKGVV